MKAEPIYDALMTPLEEGRRLAERAEHYLTSHFHHHAASTEGTAMSLATFEQDIRNDVQAGMDKAADLYNHLKAVAENLAPKIAAIQQSTVAQAVEGAFLPPEIEAEVTAIVKTYVARFGTAAPAPAPAAPETPAEPAPAEPVADPLPAQ